jgi:hypothetical protein
LLLGSAPPRAGLPLILASKCVRAPGIARGHLDAAFLVLRANGLEGTLIFPSEENIARFEVSLSPAFHAGEPCPLDPSHGLLQPSALSHGGLGLVLKPYGFSPKPTCRTTCSDLTTAPIEGPSNGGRRGCPGESGRRAERARTLAQGARGARSEARANLTRRGKIASFRGTSPSPSKTAPKKAPGTRFLDSTGRKVYDVWFDIDPEAANNGIRL